MLGLGDPDVEGIDGVDVLGVLGDEGLLEDELLELLGLLGDDRWLREEDDEELLLELEGVDGMLDGVVGIGGVGIEVWDRDAQACTRTARMATTRALVSMGTSA